MTTVNGLRDTCSKLVGGTLKLDLWNVKKHWVPYYTGGGLILFSQKEEISCQFLRTNGEQKAKILRFTSVGRMEGTLSISLV